MTDQVAEKQLVVDHHRMFPQLEVQKRDRRRWADNRQLARHMSRHEDGKRLTTVVSGESTLTSYLHTILG